MAISMLKIRRPLGRLIFNMGIAIPGKTVFLIETAPWVLFQPVIWNSILTAHINPDTSETVFAKTLKHCIVIGIT